MSNVSLWPTDPYFVDDTWVYVFVTLLIVCLLITGFLWGSSFFWRKGGGK